MQYFKNPTQVVFICGTKSNMYDIFLRVLGLNGHYKLYLILGQWITPSIQEIDTTFSTF